MSRYDAEHDRLIRLAYDIHRDARAWSARGAYVVGSTMRGCANRILHELGEKQLPYEGPGDDEAAS